MMYKGVGKARNETKRNKFTSHPRKRIAYLQCFLLWYDSLSHGSVSEVRLVYFLLWWLFSCVVFAPAFMLTVYRLTNLSGYRYWALVFLCIH